MAGIDHQNSLAEVDEVVVAGVGGDVGVGAAPDGGGDKFASGTAAQSYAPDLRQPLGALGTADGRSAVDLLDAPDKRVDGEGRGKLADDAEAGVGTAGLEFEHTHPLKAEHGAETVGDSGRGAVERRVGRVDGYAPRYSSNHRTLHGGSAGDMPETFEYEGVMGNYKVAAFSGCLGDNVGGDVETEHDPAAGGLGCERTELPAGVVPFFLESGGGEAFNRAYDVADSRSFGHSVLKTVRDAMKRSRPDTL